MSRLELVVVHWVDSRQAIPGWGYVEDVEEVEAVQCATVGWLVHAGTTALRIAQSLGDVAHPEATQCAGVKLIPRCCVTACFHLQSGRPVLGVDPTTS